jgi:hypothetical protein
MNIQEQVVDFLENTQHLSDFCEETETLSDAVNVILMDKEDDKLGRISDLYDFTRRNLALWIEDNYEDNNTAKWMYDEMVQEELF